MGKKERKLPGIIKKVGFDFNWNEEKVWKLDVPVEDMDIRELEWHFEIPFWDTPGGYYDLTPNQVVQNPGKFKDEYVRTMKTSMEYPLDIMFWNGRWLMLDGLHRLLKAKIIGMEKIKVRKIPKEAIPLIRK